MDSRIGGTAAIANYERVTVEYVNGAHAFGTSHGASAVYTPGREAIGIDARVTDMGPSEKGYAGTMRFSVVRGVPVRVCPTLAVGFERREWTPNATTAPRAR